MTTAAAALPTSRRIASAGVAMITFLAGVAHAAPPVDPSAEEALGARELAAARAATARTDVVAHARKAAEHFEASANAGGSWRAAAGAADASFLSGSLPRASAWYWLTSDRSDYSDAYLAWQAEALEAIFAKRATVTFQFNEPAETLRVDGWALPAGALERPVALDPGDHPVVATAESGGTFQGKVRVERGEAGRTKFFSVKFTAAGARRDDEVGAGVRYPRRPGEGGMSALQIINIVATSTLATAIAVGGGYVLFGSDNPRGLDSPEGAAIISVELALIAGAIVIAIVGD